MTQPAAPWYDISGYTLIQQAGTPVPKQKTLNFIGVTVTDDPGNGRTVVTLSSSGLTLAGDVTGPGNATVVARINGATAPATPLVGDVGKVIGVTGAGAYGLVAAGGSSSRFTPIDSNCQIEYSFEGTNVVSGDSNLGNGGALTIATGWASGGVNPQSGVGGLFQNCWYLKGTQGLKTGDTSIGEAASAWSVVLWINLQAYGTGYDAEIFNKKYQVGSTWSAPFTSVSMTLDHTTPGNWFATMTFGGTKHFCTPAGGIQTSATSFGGPAAIPLNQWCMLAMTYDGTITRAYFNGWLAASENGGTGAIDWGAHGAWQIGALTTQAGNGMIGLIDEFRVYSEVLSAAAIQAMYKRGLNLSDP